MPDDDWNAAPDDIGTPDVPDAAPAAEQNWLLSMPEDLQNSEILSQYKKVEDLARGHVETKRMVGDRVKIPDENASPEEVAKFYARLGRPETPDGYEFSTVELPQEMPINESMIKSFKTKAHELGLSKKQADGIYTDYLNNFKEMHTKVLQDYEAGVNQQLDVLKGRWGDDFEKNKNAAVQAFNHFAPDGLKATVEKEGWGNHPDFVELFHNIAMATSEDVMRSPGTAAFATLDEKIKAIDLELFQLPEGAPNRRDKLAERERLYNERYPAPPE